MTTEPRKITVGLFELVWIGRGRYILVDTDYKEDGLVASWSEFVELAIEILKHDQESKHKTVFADRPGIGIDDSVS